MATCLQTRFWRLLPLFLGLALMTAPLRGTDPALPPRRLQVSVLPVTLSSEDRTVAGTTSALIQDRLKDTLFQEGGYGIVERGDPAVLGPILAELGFQNGGLVAPRESRELGKLAGIEAFVVAGGELSVGMFGCVLSLRIRLIDVETSKLLGLFQVRCKGRARLNPRQSAADAVARAMDSFAAQLRDFHPPSADSM